MDLINRHTSPELSSESGSERCESNFINSIRTQATKEAYQFYFEKYRKFALGNVIDDRLIIENQVVDFLLSLKNRGLSYHSVKCYFSASAFLYNE